MSHSRHQLSNCLIELWTPAPGTVAIRMDGYSGIHIIQLFSNRLDAQKLRKWVNYMHSWKSIHPNSDYLMCYQFFVMFWYDVAYWKISDEFWLLQMTNKNQTRCWLPRLYDTVGNIIWWFLPYNFVGVIFSWFLSCIFSSSKSKVMHN